MTGVALLVRYFRPLYMVGVGAELTHDVGAFADDPAMTFGAVPGQAKCGVARDRFVLVTGVAGQFVGMAVGEAVFMAAGADTA